MGDTVFNIFGSHISEPVTRQTHSLGPNRLKENVFAGKNALSITSTPARKGFAISTPNNTDPKKKTFLQNKGASIQSYHPASDIKKTVLQSTKKSLQVYEDSAPLKDFTLTHDDILQTEYTRTPFMEGDGNLSDLEFTLSDDHLDKLVLGLPEKFDLLPSMEKQCISYSPKAINLDDILTDDIFTSFDVEDMRISDDDLPELFI